MPGARSLSTPRSGLLRTCLTAALACGAAAAWLPSASLAATDRVEIPIQSTSSQTDVTSSVVRLHVPLPKSSPTHPEACDWIQYERFRHTSGPTDATQAAAVAVLMPGLIEGAAAFDPVARNTIREAARRGRSIEVWAIDRRSNCLEDLTGVNAAEQTGDTNSLVDYYYGGKAIDGRTFGSFRKPERILAEFGVARTIEDYNAVLTTELPSQPWREQHVICGGHSLGGPLTEIYAAWDFDGNRATTQDAGYRQCAGFMGFDTTLHGDLSGGKSQPDKAAAAILSAVHGITVGGLRKGIIPRNVDFSGINPETMQLLEAVGMLAHREPNTDWSPLLARLPHSSASDEFFHLSGAADMNRYLFSKDSMRDIHYSYAAALGQIMDDNGAVFGLVRSSFGFFDGVPVRRNALPSQLSKVPLLGQFVAPGALALPQRKKNSPVVLWRNFDTLGIGTTQLGLGFTTPAAEVTDIRDLSRILFEGPTNLTENWFPLRLLLEQFEIDGGDRSAEFRGLQHLAGVTQKPRFVVIAGDGLRGNRATLTDPHVTLPGYQHLDVLTASERQTGGQPEGSSQAFANFIDEAIPTS